MTEHRFGAVVGGRARPQEIRRRLIHGIAAGFHYLRDTRAGGEDFRDVRLHVRLVLDRRKGHRLGDDVHIVGILDGEQRGDQVGRSDDIPGARAGERIGFRQRATDQHVGKFTGQVHAVPRGEVGIRLIDQHHPGKRRAEGPDLLLGKQQARGCVRVGEIKQRRPVVVRHVPLVIGGKRHGVKLRRSNIRENRVQRIRGIKRTDRSPVLDKRPGAQGEHLVRPVGGKHLVRAVSVQIGDALAQGERHRIGIHTHLSFADARQRLHDLGRRRVRVFVGVEFDQPGNTRLLTGHIAVHRLDVPANQIVGRVHGYSNRIFAERPCASSFSTSANASMCGSTSCRSARV